MTSSGIDLADPHHRDHKKPYVQDWLRDIGPRKVEANALVTAPDAGRELCFRAITPVRSSRCALRNSNYDWI